MKHFLTNIDLEADTPDGFKRIIFGAGCFWGVERKFWSLNGVWLTSVGYSGGDIINPTYEQVCYENTNHAEVVQVTYDPKIISINTLLKTFWECHDPTQGMRQGNDIGTQYRSAIYVSENEDLVEVKETMKEFQKLLDKNGYKKITTEIKRDIEYYFAEAYHQQYLYKNPNGYCGLGGIGIKFQ